MNADLLPVFSLGPWKTPNTHEGLAKLANFMRASTFSVGNTGIYGCSTDDLWLILKIVETAFM